VASVYKEIGVPW